MQDFNNLGFTTCEQHIMHTFLSGSQFAKYYDLSCCKDDVNVDDFQLVRKTSLKKMTGQPVFTYTVNIGFNDIGFNDKSLITTHFACPESRSIINITSDLATNRI